jgi:NADPH2:quinone reductase
MFYSLLITYAVEAATIPLVTLTAVISLFRRQSLPAPWSPLPLSNTSTPLVIYGASSALGCFTIKLASLAHIHPTIAVCGLSKDYVRTLLDDSKGDKIVDYRQGVDAWKEEVQRHLVGQRPPMNALDAISANGTWIPLAQVLANSLRNSVDPPTSPKLSVVSGAAHYTDAGIPDNIDIIHTYVGTAHYGAYKTYMPKQPSDKDEVKADIEFA